MSSLALPEHGGEEIKRRQILQEEKWHSIERRISSLERENVVKLGNFNLVN